MTTPDNLNEPGNLVDLSAWADRIQSRLGTGRRVEVYRRTTSTQDLVRRRAGENLLVIAAEQTAGRGRLGRPWIAPPAAAALFSFTCPAPATGNALERLSLVAAVCTATAIEHLAPSLRIGIKWPNDLVIDGRKLAGILVETAADRCIIGIGINTDLSEADLPTVPADFRDRITSLRLSGARVDPARLIAETVAAIDAAAAADPGPLIAQWRRRSILCQQRLTFGQAGERITGTVVDLDHEAGLIIRRDTGELLALPTATTTVLSTEPAAR